MALLSLDNVHLTYGERELLRGVSLLVGDRDRVGIVGPNGSGKSTLLRILAGVEPPDDGKRTVRRDLTLGYLSQDPALDPNARIRDIAREGLVGRDEVLAQLEHVHTELAAPGCTTERQETLLTQQTQLEDRLERLGGHDVEHRVEALICAVGLDDPDAHCADLSGGERRRAALARLLVSNPEVLLLDEPTNHLDAEVIAWLEEHLSKTRSALVLVTHDRYFLDRVVDRIVELDRGVLHEYRGGYVDFLVARADRLEREQKAEATRQNLLRRETEWIRRGPPARTTKSKARIERYAGLREAAPEAGPDELAFSIPCAQRLGERVISMTRCRKAFDGRTVLDGVDIEIARGERLGIVGPNGAGKTTFLKLCMGLVEPDSGTVTRGPTVRFSFVDQARSDLDPAKTVVEEVGGGNDHVFVDGRQLRVESYLERFLFPSAMMRTSIGDLSGGERNRVLIAKLLSIGGNVLVLDEPTNDLDLMTLRVLEEALCAFDGSALIVSHDRWFLDRVATRILHLASDGRHRIHSGDLSSLLDTLAEEAAQRADDSKPRAPQPTPTADAPATRKLSTRERTELEQLPERIAAAEADLASLDEQLADPALYSGDPAAVRDLTERRQACALSVQELYARWEELESLENA